MILDEYDRTFKVLRLSLTNSCNFSCSYCVPSDESVQLLNKAKKSSNVAALIAHVANVHQLLNLEAVRLTGGEPLLYYEINEVIQGLAEIGIPRIKMTTNAWLLKNKALELKKAGLHEVNISLDAMSEEAFLKVTGRKNITKVFEGIDAALEAGIDVKLNAVIKRGENEQEVLPLLEYARQKGIVIRYLELMAMGHLFDAANSSLYTQNDILQDIQSQYEIAPLLRKQSSTANYWETNTGQVFGIIANESQPFCHDCNRLRMDQDGKIFGCISDHNGIQLTEEDDRDETKKKLQSALKKKQQLKFVGSKMSMIEIGG